MRKILLKFSFLIICLFISFLIFPQVTTPPPGHPGGVPPPEGADCCDYLYEGDDPDGSPEYQACLLDPAAHCPIPVDNSRYIYITMVAGIALASFVIVKAVERKNKRTPM